MNNCLLFDALSYGNISEQGIASVVERIQQVQREEIEKKHKYKISFNKKENHWYTRVDGKKVKRKCKDDLLDYLIGYYNKDLTLNGIFKEYLDNRKLRVSPRTWSKDINLYNKYLKGSKLANMPIKSIKLSDGYDFVEYCLTIKPDMKKKYWANLKGFLNAMIQYAIDMEYRTTNPFEHLKPFLDKFQRNSLIRDGDTVFTREETRKVIELAELDSKNTGTSEPLGIVILFNLALRCGELCALKWSDIEENNGNTYIHIQRELVANIDDNGKSNGFIFLDHTKTLAGDRRLILNSKAIYTFELIKELNKSNNLPVGLNDYIFLRIVKENITNCTPSSFDPRLRRYCKQADMSVIKSPHDIRRTAITNLYNANMPLNKIREYAGHSSIQQTMDYIRITDDDMDMIQFLETLDVGDEIPQKKDKSCQKKDKTFKIVRYNKTPETAYLSHS